MVSSSQLSLDYEPTLLDQFRTLKQCLAAVVYGSRLGLSGVASHCDLSPSALSRMLNENDDDPRHLPVDLVEKIIAATGDTRPISWLAARFLPTEDMRRTAALQRVEAALPALEAALVELRAKPRR